MSTLHEISGCDDPDRRADVLFLHGLGGDAFGTWRHGEDKSTSWPQWLGQEFPQVGVWSLGYAASPTKRFRFLRRLLSGFSRDSRDVGQAMSLPDRAGQVLDLMAQRDFGQRPLLLICHSLGGLLAKQVLRKARDSPEPGSKAIFRNTRAVLFLATPHTGADLASFATAFSKLFATTISLQELQAHDAHLRDLYDWYRNHSAEAGIRTLTYFEGRDLLGFRIVDESSSHPGVGANPIRLDEDHVSIAKPRKSNAQVCGAARKLLQKHVLGIEDKQQEPAEAASLPARPADALVAPEPVEDPTGASRESSEGPLMRVEGLSSLRTYGDGFAGREPELAQLDKAWNDGAHIWVWHAQGGAGKTRVVVEWLNRLRDDDWRGAGRVFVHSFYSQGSDARRNATSEIAFPRALAFFGYAGPPIIDHTEQGRVLARLLLEQRGLLVLDGLEPLQHPPSIDKGQLKDPGVRSLMRRLSLAGPGGGMCLITSRQPLIELDDKIGRTVQQRSLDQLDGEAGAELLKQFDVNGTEAELYEAVADLHGHAYSLMLLGSYLSEATDHRDIRRRHNFLLRDQTKHEKHPFHADHLFEAYVRHLGESSAEVALLHLLGFFNRPAERDLIEALIAADPQFEELSRLTAALRDLSEADLNRALAVLRKLRLLDLESPSNDGTGDVATTPVDTHPLLREYFAEHLQERWKAAWTEGHRRLYEHLCESTEHQPDTLAGLQPLYQAVAHGCQAGLHQQACDDVYIGRILRGTKSGDFYSIGRLGAFGEDLGAVACFFDRPWSQVSQKLSIADQAWLLNQAAFLLRALGRPTEALEPMRAGPEMAVENQDWKNAAIQTGNLSELKLTLGKVYDALADAERSVLFADRSVDQFQRMSKRTTHGNVLHQAGRREEARSLFVDAEAMQADRQPQYPRLYSVQGFEYCDLLLSRAERLAWRFWLRFSLQDAPDGLPADNNNLESELRQPYDHVTKRATQTLEWTHGKAPLLTIALDHLTLARAALYRWLTLNLASIVEDRHPTILGRCPEALTQHITAAVIGLREAGAMDHLLLGLLTRAWQLHSTGDSSAAAANLDEAWEIAAKGPMPLFQTDILLTRARLFFRDDLAAAKKNLAEAGRLIEKHGYHRRDEELSDAEEALRRCEHPPEEQDREPSVTTPVVAKASQTVGKISDEDLLKELRDLPAAWFDQLVFGFDLNNAVSARPAAQLLRAMDLVTVLRAIDPDFAKVREAIDRLKGASR